MNIDPRPGQCYPLGANFRPGGVNFAVFSKNCTAVELLLFDRVDDPQPSRVIPLDPHQNRTFYYWHVFVPRLQAGQLYGYRVHGPFAPEHGHRFDGTKLLLDPYSRVVMYPATSPSPSMGEGRGGGEAASGYSTSPPHPNPPPQGGREPNTDYAQSLKSVVMDPRAYNWEADAPLRRPLSESIIYEMHVGGFTKHPSANIDSEKRGTYAGMIEKIPYLVELGVTAVELLPIQQHLEQLPSAPGISARTDYWGYNPIAMFAPHRGYSARRDPVGPADEFRDLVKALHRAGIEVILDMVFNHTAELDENGPTLCFRGFENRAYYILGEDNRYANFTGCGNTFNGNHSIVRRLILECLRYWVQVMHVDGFRFDLASVLARDEEGHPLKNPPILWEIESDPVLAGCKIIAEAWDAAGLYQVGSFIGDRWAEWNGQFRDDVRRFVKSDEGTVGKFAARLHGSPDIYPLPDRDPHRSINFITCHDGFTLHDLVSYDSKHNEANGENNRDGADANWSWNCGAEGDTDNADTLALRRRQMKNHLATLLLAQGTPMLLMGDEVCRSQRGNNNAYCQDNELSWFDWTAETRFLEETGFLRFVQKLIRFRKGHSVFLAERFWTSDGQGDQGLPRITWHGVRLNTPDWGDDSHTLAFTLISVDEVEHLHVMLNAYWEALQFELPPVVGKTWHRAVDTSLTAPEDIAAFGSEPAVSGTTYQVSPRSVVVLTAR